MEYRIRTAEYNTYYEEYDYYVTADSEEEAIELFNNGGYDDVEQYYQEWDEQNSQEITDIESYE